MTADRESLQGEGQKQDSPASVQPNVYHESPMPVRPARTSQLTSGAHSLDAGTASLDSTLDVWAAGIDTRLDSWSRDVDARADVWARNVDARADAMNTHVEVWAKGVDVRCEEWGRSVEVWAEGVGHGVERWGHKVERWAGGFEKWFDRSIGGAGGADDGWRQIEDHGTEQADPNLKTMETEEDHEHGALSSPPQAGTYKEDEVEDKAREDADVFVVVDASNDLIYASALEEASGTEILRRRTGREMDTDTDGWDFEDD